MCCLFDVFFDIVPKLLVLVVGLAALMRVNGRTSLSRRLLEEVLDACTFAPPEITDVRSFQFLGLEYFSQCVCGFPSHRYFNCEQSGDVADHTNEVRLLQFCLIRFYSIQKSHISATINNRRYDRAIALYEDSLKVAKDEVLKTKGREAKELKMAAVPPIGANYSCVCPIPHAKSFFFSFFF